MPGAKRRALKKLLTPSQNPAHFHSNGMNASQPFEVSPSITPPPTLSYSPTDPHADPYALDASQSQAEAQDAKILDDMEARKHVMGSAQSVHSIGNTSAPETSATGVPPNHTSLSPPPMADRTVHKSASAPAAIKGTITLTADDLIDANENGNGKGKKKSSKQRFLEREARKKEERLNAVPQQDPAETARIEREKMEEDQVISKACQDLNVRVHEIEPDGHCMYSAIADQLYHLGLLKSPSYHETRHAAASYLIANPDTFMPFVPSVMGEDMEGAMDDGIMTPEGYKEYCRIVKEGTNWGGEIEIQALSRAFNIPIHVIQRGPPTIIAHSPSDEGSGSLTPEESLAQGKVVRVAYFRKLYGLGEHYNSLRPC